MRRYSRLAGYRSGCVLEPLEQLERLEQASFLERLEPLEQGSLRLFRAPNYKVIDKDLAVQ